jgi:peptidoglycan/LPS O-acetylase OafA/YrhL
VKPSDFIQLSLDEARRDPDRLRKLLEAQMAYERMRGRRRLLVALLAVIGGLLWLGALWPTMPRPLRSGGLALWVLCFALAIVCALREWHWSRIRKRLQDPP